MRLCPSLSKIQRRYVDFDPRNPSHLNAFEMLCLGVMERGERVFRQHPTLRFHLDAPFEDVRAMMLTRVAEAYIHDQRAQQVTLALPHLQPAAR